MTYMFSATDQMLTCLESGDQFLPEYVWRLDDIICGCGDPGAVWEWATKELFRLLPTDGEKRPRSLTGTEWLGLYLLDHLRYTTHGFSITNAWLTSDGLALLGFLLRWGPEWRDLRWVGEDGVSRGNVVS